MRGRTGIEARAASNGGAPPPRHPANVAPPSTTSAFAGLRRRSNVGSLDSRRTSSNGRNSSSSAASPSPTASSSVGSTAQRRPRSPVFWGATADAPLFAGPLGEVVGAVPAGAVLLEAMRHRDAFGGWWIASRCEDGTLGWVSYSDGLDDADDSTAAAQRSEGSGEASTGAPLWQRLYDTRATPVAAVEGMHESKLRPGLPNTHVDWRTVVPALPAADLAQLPKAHFLFADTELYEHYWDRVQPTQKQARDWNWHYQAALEQHWLAAEFTRPITTAAPNPAASSAPPHGASASTPSEVEILMAAFQAEVERCVVRICHEAVVPLTSRTIPSHPRYPETVFYCNGILARRCVDTADGALGGDEAAAKVGLALYRHCAMLAALAPRHVLHVPLHALCTFGGFSFLCSSIPPYDSASLMHADAAVQAGSSEAKAKTPPLVTELLRGLSETLHFEGGAVPVEWRVYAGRDRRLYLAQTQRLLPPTLPLLGTDAAASAPTNASPATSAAASEPGSAAEGEGGMATCQRYSELLRRGVRPELFFGWPAPWPANECVRSAAVSGQDTDTHLTPGKATALASASYAAGQWVKSDGITKVSGTLGMQFAVAAPTLPTAKCNACDASIDADELRFVVCASAARCCRVCIHCHTRLVLHEAEAEAATAAVEPLARVLPEAVRCGAECRKAGSFLMEPSTSELMHANGLSLRYLAYVLHRLPQPTRPAVEHLCEAEMVARAAKQLLQQDLRGATTPTEARATCASFLAALLQPSGAPSERFWRTRLGPALQSHFDGLCEPFHLSRHAFRLLAERVAELTGITLSPASVASMALLGDEPRPTQRARTGSTGPQGADPITPDSGKPTEEAGEGVARGSVDGHGPFIEITHIGPRTRIFALPPVRAPTSPPHTGTPATELGKDAVDEGAGASLVRRRLERLLVFWIGFTPDNAVDAQQPFYLDESLLQATL